MVHHTILVSLMISESTEMLKSLGGVLCGLEDIGALLRSVWSTAEVTARISLLVSVVDYDPALLSASAAVVVEALENDGVVSADSRQIVLVR